MTSGAFQFTGVYNYGKNSYIDGLPQLQISSNAVTTNFDAQTIIDALEGVGATIVESSYKFPTVDEYAQSYLYAKKSYDPTTNIFIHNNTEYSFVEAVQRSTVISTDNNNYTYYYLNLTGVVLNQLRYKHTETVEIIIRPSIYTDGTLNYDEEVTTTTTLLEYYDLSDVLLASYEYVSDISVSLIEEGTGAPSTTSTIITETTLTTDIPYSVVFKEYTESIRNTTVVDANYDQQNINYTKTITLQHKISDTSEVTYTYNDYTIINSGTGITDAEPTVETDYISDEYILQDNVITVSGFDSSYNKVIIPDGSRKKVYFVKYYITDPGVFYYFCYYQRFDLWSDNSSISGLVSQFNSYQPANTDAVPLPVIPLKYESVWWENFTDTQLKDDVKNLLDKLHISPEDLIKSLKENNDGTNNTSASKVTEAFVEFSISFKESEHNEYVAEYLFTYLEQMESNMVLIDDTDFDTGVSITMKEGKFNSFITYQYTNPVIKAGVTSTGNKYDYYISADNANVIVQNQINDTEIKEHVMKNVTYYGIIRRSNDVFGVNKNLDNNAVAIPLLFEFVQDLSIYTQIELLSHSVRLTAYASEYQHLEWYETKAFAGLIQFAAYAIAIVSFVYTAGQSGWLIALANAALSLAIGFGIKLAIEYIYNQTDNELIRAVASVAAIVGMTYSGYKMGDTSNLVFSSAIASANIVSLSMNMDVALKLEELQNKREAFKEIYESRMSKLEKAKKALKGNISTNAVLDMVEDMNWKPYIFGISAYYDIAKGSLATNYDLMYNTGSNTDDFYFEKLNVGVL